MEKINKNSIWQPHIMYKAVKDSFIKLDPRQMIRNPVMLVVEIVSIITTIITIQDIINNISFLFNLQITLWLWFTVLFANFAEALAEGKGKAQAESLKNAKKDIIAKKILPTGEIKPTNAQDLKKGDVVVAYDNHIIPSDGEIIEGVALVDESAITGESAPVVREFGGDKSGVTGGTTVLSGSIKIRITAEQGETFLDQMIKMVEGAKRKKNTQ